MKTFKTSKLLSFILISLITFQLLSCKTEKTEKQKQLEAQELENYCYGKGRVTVTALLRYRFGKDRQYANVNVVLGHMGQVIDRGYRFKDGCLEIKNSLWNDGYIMEACGDSIIVESLQLHHILEFSNIK